ncbi:hypothetical protein [Mesorhizobium sp.]|uniref:hypothetical protein n=1 Tax=Mesorhizobium sp. TaxID=1871066 RepID=UPI0025C6BF44|nr:hypothetical protein [Mesorhizobium sp.]
MGWIDAKFATKSEHHTVLSEYEITYVFVDGFAERLRPGQKREPVLAHGAS